MAENSKMPAKDLSQRLRDEADLCRNDGAQDIANLLDEAAAELEAQARVAICPRGHDWHDFGSLGGRKVSWCPRCDTLAYTGREPPSGAPTAPAAKAEQHRPDVLERLTYHALERDDLTLEECLSFLADGWRKVHGRTERQMVMQILALLAGAPAQPAEVKAERVPADVVEAAQRIQANGYRAPLAWARKVFDWVASQEPTQPTEARAERAAALETNCAANAMLRTVNRMVEASSVGDDALVAMAEQIRAEAERMSREATGVLIRSKTKDATQSTSTTGGA